MMYNHARGRSPAFFSFVIKHFGYYGLFVTPFVALAMEKSFYDTCACPIISHVPACMTTSSARTRAHHAFLRAHVSVSCVASCALAVLTMIGHAREFQPCVYGVSTPTSGLMTVRGRDFRVVAMLCRPYHWCHCEKTASLSGTSSRPHCLHSTLPAHNDEARGMDVLRRMCGRACIAVFTDSKWGACP